MAGPSAQNDNKAYILWKYPDDFTDDKVLKSIMEFAFPCQIADEAIQLFSFVLTNELGNYTFGYCRHAPKSNTCLCFLSALPWSELFYKFLNHVASVMNASSSRAEEVEALLVRAYHQEIPVAGDTFVVDSRLGLNKMECVCPDDTKLPRIPDNRHLTEYYNAVDEDKMKAVWASMLCERRIIFVSSKLGRLSSCVIAANLLIYPMHWQHIFIPVLPENIFTYLHAPMPFLIGVPTVSYTKAMREVDMNEVVVLNIDKKEFHSPFNDLESMPTEVTSVLKKNLKNSNHLLGDGVSRSFLRALVVLIGGYREALTFRPGEQLGFSKDKFVLTRPPLIQPFLQRMLELQIFEQFIKERLHILNGGSGNVRDEFEEECNLYTGKDYNKMKYRYLQYVDNVTKKTHETVQSFQDIAKGRGINSLQSIKDKFNDMKNQSASSIPSSDLDHSGDETKETLFKYESFTVESKTKSAPERSLNIDLFQELSPILSSKTPILDQLEKSHNNDDGAATAFSSFPNGRLKNSKSYDQLIDRSCSLQTEVDQRPIEEIFPKCYLNKSRTSGDNGFSNNESLLIDFGSNSNGKPVKYNENDLIFDPLLNSSARIIETAPPANPNLVFKTVANTNTDLASLSPKSNVDLLVDFFNSAGTPNVSSNYQKNENRAILNGSKSNENIFHSSSFSSHWETFE